MSGSLTIDDLFEHAPHRDDLDLSRMSAARDLAKRIMKSSPEATLDEVAIFIECPRQAAALNAAKDEIRKARNDKRRARKWKP